MGSTSSKSGRDAAFFAAATIISGIIARELELDAVEAGFLGTVIFGAISFGWRVLRHYAPWIEDAAA